MSDIDGKRNKSKLGSISKNDDRLSDLPDEILYKILSFIPTKDAVSTSVLSTKWKYLYRSVPAIVFDDSLCPPHDKLALDKFIGSLNRLFLLRNVFDLHKFHLTCKRVDDISKINEWICAALCRNVQDLMINSDNNILTILSSEVFECKSLVSLKLHGFSVDVLPKVISLPNLKALELKWVIFRGSASDKCFPRILEGCPSLEELYLKLVSVEGAKYLDLSSPSLRLLSLWYCPPIVLDNPNLVHLKSVYVGQMTVKNLKSLAAAELGDRPSCPSSWTNLFNEFLNVKILSLSCKIWEDCQIPIFGNLTELEFVTLYRTQLKICALILDRAPCLAKLRVYMGRMESDDIFEYHRPIHSKLNTLREVEIVNCQGFECQMSFVEYLLQVGEALKVFKFMFKMPGGKSSKDWPYSAMKRLAICPRPPACKILLP